MHDLELPPKRRRQPDVGSRVVPCLVARREAHVRLVDTGRFGEIARGAGVAHFEEIVPSAALTRNGIGGVYPASANFASGACPRRLISVPSVRRSSTVCGCVRLEYESITKLPEGENTGACCPGAEVNAVNPVSPNATR